MNIPKEQVADTEELMMLAIDFGAEDFKDDEDPIQIISAPEKLTSLKQALQENGYNAEASISYIPKNTTRVTGRDAEKVLTLLNALEDMDDVQEVFSNFEMDDSEMEALLSQLNQ